MLSELGLNEIPRMLLQGLWRLPVYLLPKVLVLLGGQGLGLLLLLQGLVKTFLSGDGQGSPPAAEPSPPPPTRHVPRVHSSPCEAVGTGET